MSIQFSVNSITVWYLCDLIIGGWIEDDQNDFIVKKIKAFIYSPYFRIIYLSIYLSIYYGLFTFHLQWSWLTQDIQYQQNIIFVFDDTVSCQLY